MKHASLEVLTGALRLLIAKGGLLAHLEAAVRCRSSLPSLPQRVSADHKTFSQLLSFCRYQAWRHLCTCREATELSLPPFAQDTARVLSRQSGLSPLSILQHALPWPVDRLQLSFEQL